MITTSHADAVIAHLRLKTNRPIGDGQAVKQLDDRSDDDYPYCVVYEFDTFSFNMSGPINNPQADMQIHYNLISVGRTRKQCDMMNERVRAAMFDGTLQVEGFHIQQVLFDLAGRTKRDDDIRPPLFTKADRIYVQSTPMA